MVFLANLENKTKMYTVKEVLSHINDYTYIYMYSDIKLLYFGTISNMDDEFFQKVKNELVICAAFYSEIEEIGKLTLAVNLK